MESEIDLFKKIINKIEDKVDYADIYAGNGNNTNIVMKDNKVQEINTGISNGARIRVLNNGAWGFAYTNDLNKLEEISKTAIKISKSLKGNVKLAETEIIKDKVKTPRKISVNDVDIDEKKELMADANKSALIDNVISTTLNYQDSESETAIVTSEGTEIIQNETRVGLWLNTVASSGNLIQFGHGSLGGVKGYEVLKDADIESFGRKVGEKAVRLLNANTPPSGKFPIITDNELTGVFIHEALGHGVESDLILQNDSVLKDKLGDVIGSDIVNIFDDPSNKNGFGYYEYDVEGVKTSKNQLVENGKLISLLC